MKAIVARSKDSPPNLTSKIKRILANYLTFIPPEIIGNSVWR